MELARLFSWIFKSTSSGSVALFIYCSLDTRHVGNILYTILIGWTGDVIYSNKEHIVATLLLHEIIWKRESAINQLMQGLKLLNVLDAVRKFPQNFQTKFVYMEVPLTATVLKDHLEFSETSNTDENVETMKTWKSHVVKVLLMWLKYTFTYIKDYRQKI